MSLHRFHNGSKNNRRKATHRLQPMGSSDGQNKHNTRTRNYDSDFLDWCSESTRRGNISHDMFRIMQLHNTDINYQDINHGGNTALHYATRHCWLKAVVKLLRNNATADLINLEGNTPFLEACKSGSLFLVKTFAKRTDVNVNHQNFSGETGLHLAIKNRQFIIVNFLISLHRLDPTIKDHQGLTAKDLLSDNKTISVQYRTKFNECYDRYTKGDHNTTPTALHLAVRAGDYIKTEEVLAHSPHLVNWPCTLSEPLETENFTIDSFVTALHIAAFNGNKKIAELLLKNGATNDSLVYGCVKNPERVNKIKLSPLSLALGNEVFALLGKHDETTKRWEPDILRCPSSIKREQKQRNKSNNSVPLLPSTSSPPSKETSSFQKNLSNGGGVTSTTFITQIPV